MIALTADWQASIRTILLPSSSEDIAVSDLFGLALHRSRIPRDNSLDFKGDLYIFEDRPTRGVQHLELR